MELSAIVPLPISVADSAFHPLAGRVPLTRVAGALLGAVADPGRVVVAAAEPLIDEVRGALAAHPGVGVVSAPETREQCVAAALEYLAVQEFPTTHVLIGDVSRPLMSSGSRDRVIAGLRDGGVAVMPTVPVTDSVKAVDERGAVTATLDRSTLRAVQFPRGFTTDQLAQFLDGAAEEFDELQAALGADVPITVVDGDADGFAVDLPADADFVEAIIARRADLRA